MKSFEQLKIHLQQRRIKKRVAVVCPHDECSREALRMASEAGFASPLVFDGESHEEVCREAVLAVRRGEADVLMKGLVNTDVLLRAILDKEEGLLPRGEVLTHVTCAELPDTEHRGEDCGKQDAPGRLLLFTDAAVLPYPTDEQRVAQLRCVLQVARSLGIGQPRVSLVNCSEKVAPKAFPFTLHYRQLCEEAVAGHFGPCIVDGPLDLKTSLSPEALRKKGLSSPVGGRADALVFPDIQAGNVFYKTLTLFGCETAGMLCGTVAPVVLPSRGDSAYSKLASLMLAIAYKQT